PPVLARKRHSLRRALIDDVQTELRQPVNIGFARAEISAFDRVVKKTKNAVSVVLIILGRVDPALSRDAVGTSRTILIAKARNVITQFGERSGGRSAGESGADNNDVEFALVRGIHQLHRKFMVVPLLINISWWNFRIEFHKQSLRSKTGQHSNGNCDKPYDNYNGEDCGKCAKSGIVLRTVQAHGLKHAPDSMI